MVWDPATGPVCMSRRLQVRLAPRQKEFLCPHAWVQFEHHSERDISLEGTKGRA